MARFFWISAEIDVKCRRRQPQQSRKHDGRDDRIHLELWLSQHGKPSSGLPMWNPIIAKMSWDASGLICEFCYILGMPALCMLVHTVQARSAKCQQAIHPPVRDHPSGKRGLREHLPGSHPEGMNKDMSAHHVMMKKGQCMKHWILAQAEAPYLVVSKTKGVHHRLLWSGSMASQSTRNAFAKVPRPTFVDAVNVAGLGWGMASSGIGTFHLA